MEISGIEQEINDYDWFAVDSELNIAFFASAGGILPTSVAKSAEDNAVLVSYFQGLTADEAAYLINNEFAMPKDIVTNEQRRYFFRTYAFYSARGMFSFDRRTSSAFEYELITQPQHCLSFTDLPDAIQLLLARTKYNGNFWIDNVIDTFTIK